MSEDINNFCEYKDQNPSGTVIRYKGEKHLYQCNCGANVWTLGEYKGHKDAYKCSSCGSIIWFEDD